MDSIEKRSLLPRSKLFAAFSKKSPSFLPFAPMISMKTRASVPALKL